MFWWSTIKRTMRSIVRRFIQQQKVGRVSEAENGSEALQFLAKHKDNPPDIIVCDLHMDQMDGLDFVNRLRRNKDMTPVIILTGEQDPLVQEVIRQVGAAQVLNKPIAAADLAREFRQTVGFF